MRVLILADLHDDFWADCGRSPLAGIEQDIAQLDHVVLAGDVSNKPKVRWRAAFDRLAQLVPLDRVSIFPGNHDFYDFRIDGEDRLTDIAAASGVAYVQKQQIVLGKTRLLCATLWTDFELGLGSAVNAGLIARQMNDFRKIRVAAGKYRKLWPSDLITRHRDHVDWLDRMLSTPFAGPTYVVTHHAPHPDVLRPRPEGLDAAFASDLSALIKRHRPAAWLFGHSHDAQDITLGPTALRNVALGYPDEVADPARRILDCIFEL